MWSYNAIDHIQPLSIGTGTSAHKKDKCWIPILPLGCLIARASVKRNGELRLIGKDQYGHEILMEMHKKYGGTSKGTTPMDLFLVALGGCAGLDIVTMLKARRQLLTSYEVKINGIRRKEQPKL
ncbi:MAG: OsmC family protein [Candidatus Verstraetearchaeota archaeon]|nr:OsmC family protein [Candidatus Verstraetearchaeota archaeon]